MGAPAVHVVGDHRSDLGRIRHVALEAGLLSRACPRALPCGAASCPSSTAARSASPDEPDARPIAGTCRPADSREDLNLAVLVRQLGRYCESELSLYPPSALTRIEERVAVYRTHLQQVRGFAPSTVANHARTAGEFLTTSATRSTRRGSPRSTARISTPSFLCAVGPRQSRASLQHVVGHLRAFLRFLASAGEIPTGLDAQIDTPRVYRDEQLPRALPWDTVRALLHSIDRATPMGRRD